MNRHHRRLRIADNDPQSQTNDPHHPPIGHVHSAFRIPHSALARRSRGQTLVIVALMMTVLLLFVGLGVDVGNLMAKRAKLQSATDSATLSAALLMADSNVNPNIVATKAMQILNTNGVLTPTLNMGQTQVTFPATNQV